MSLSVLFLVMVPSGFGAGQGESEGAEVQSQGEPCSWHMTACCCVFLDSCFPESAQRKRPDPTWVKAGRGKMTSAEDEEDELFLGNRGYFDKQEGI